jgi:hypothetical protein
MDEYPYSNTFGNDHSSTFTIRMTDCMTEHTPEYYDRDRNRPYNAKNNVDETINFKKTPVTMNEQKNHLWKYNEDKILKDVQDYVTSTYKSHYCGHQQEYQGVQTIDLMAAKELASDFCQANILKYGSRYGDKDGRSKRDLLKVIHYAMLLLHFDGHYSRRDNGLTEFR